jgi:hypothetical protein
MKVSEYLIDLLTFGLFVVFVIGAIKLVVS